MKANELGMCPRDTTLILKQNLTQRPSTYNFHEASEQMSSVWPTLSKNKYPPLNSSTAECLNWPYHSPAAGSP